jgi:outer membrane murein-binding lipoprotein Lpp
MKMLPLVICAAFLGGCASDDLHARIRELESRNRALAGQVELLKQDRDLHKRLSEIRITKKEPTPAVRSSYFNMAPDVRQSIEAMETASAIRSLRNDY